MRAITRGKRSLTLSLARALAPRLRAGRFVSSALAGLLGCVTAAMGYIRANEGSKPQIAFTLGSSMFVISMAANFLGVIFPFGAIAVGIDPAVSSSPLITTVIDVFGISVYLAIARSILGL